MTATDISDIVLAVDGGGSKTDVVLLDTDGRLLAWERGPGSSPQIIGLDQSVRVIDSLISRVLGRHDLARLRHVGLYLSGLDFAEEIIAFKAAIADLPWSATGLTVDNDLHALLRSGTEEDDAVAVICGTGMNAIGVHHDGVTVRFAALGALSGDWGGGSELGDAVIWHAARAEDGRGPTTLLRELLLAATEEPSVSALIENVHLRRTARNSFSDLAPLVFQAASAGDAVAVGVVHRQAEEIVAYVRACVHRLGFASTRIPLVLGGGVARGRDPLLLGTIRHQLAIHAPLTRLEIVDVPPVVGAASLVLRAVSAQRSAIARARDELGADASFFGKSYEFSL